MRGSVGETERESDTTKLVVSRKREKLQELARE